MYILLCGYPPFTGKTAEEIMSRIKKGKYEFPGRNIFIVNVINSELKKKKLKKKKVNGNIYQLIQRT